MNDERPTLPPVTPTVVSEHVHARHEPEHAPEVRGATSGTPALLTGHRPVADVQDAILDALPGHIALINSVGVIVAVNESWRRFATANLLPDAGFGVGQNYLTVCEDARGTGAADALAAAIGIRNVLHGTVSNEQLYPRVVYFPSGVLVYFSSGATKCRSSASRWELPE